MCFPRKRLAKLVMVLQIFFVCALKISNRLEGFLLKTFRIPFCNNFVEREFHKILQVLRCLLFACYQSFVQIFDHFLEYEGQIFGCLFFDGSLYYLIKNAFTPTVQ